MYKLEISPYEQYVSAFYTDLKHCIWKENNAESADNYAALSHFMDVPRERILRAPENHSASIALVKALDEEPVIAYRDEEFKIKPTGYDGYVTNVPGILLCVTTADCTPIYLFDPKKKAIAMVHSGWRGTLKKISAAAIRVMEKEFGSSPSDIIAIIGPCICKNCYEIGAEVLALFEKHFKKEAVENFTTASIPGKYLLDTKGAVIQTLLDCGIESEKISDLGICSYEDKRFPSYRRTGSEIEHTLSGIMLKAGR